MSFATGFAQGRGMANDAFDRQRQDQLDKMAKESHDLDQKIKLGLYGDQERVRSATDDLNVTTRTGVRNQPNIDANNADFDIANNAAAQGLDIPKFDPATQAPEWRPATRSELNTKMLGLASAKGDMSAMAVLDERGNKFKKDDDLRSYAGNLKALAQDPKRADEYRKEMAPAIKAFSDFTGIPSNFHFDPVTNKIIETPYGKPDPKTGKMVYGAPQEVSLDTAMPYLMAYRNMSSGYGDPETAAKAMHDMSNEERTKRFEEAKASLESATKLSSASAAQRTAASGEIGANARMITALATKQRYSEMAKAEKNTVMGVQQVLIPDATGKMVPGISGLRVNIKTGELEPFSMPMGGPGSVPLSALDPAKLEKVAAQMIGKPTGKLLNGKPVMHTEETAMAAARDSIVSNYLGRDKGPDNVKGDAQAILKAANGAPTPSVETAIPTGLGGLPRLGRPATSLETLMREANRPATVRPDWENMPPSALPYGTKGW